MLFWLALLSIAPLPVSANPTLPERSQLTLAAAESTARGAPVIQGKKGLEPPKIDGRLDDPAWSMASLATDFTQNYPQNGAPPTRQTEARVLFVGDALYVAIRAFDSPDSIVAPLMRRDSRDNTDMLQVLIDSFHDRRTAFEFGVTPSGVKFDGYHYDDIQLDDSWDGVWDVAVGRDSLGWTAEFRIPLSQLRYSVSPDRPASWGINFYRNVSRRQEWSSWAPVRRGESREVSQFGELTNIDSLKQAPRREITPYVSTSMTRAVGDRTDPFFRPTAFGNSAGLDAKLGVTSGLTLDLTVHPDFGQVEADPSEVNLSGFETTLQERRPFFVENGGLFSLPIYESTEEVLFYPRRIGRMPQITLDPSSGFVSEPQQTSLLGAAKLSGKTSSGLSVGFLDAATRAEFAETADSAGSRSRVLVEPKTNYAVLRLQQDLRGGKSAIGAMFTATNRLAMGTTASQLHAAAYSGGLDFRHRFGGQNGQTYEVFGALFASDVRGSATAIAETERSSAHYFQRPDADHIDYDTTRTTMSGFGARLQADRATGRIRYGNAFYTRTPGFEVNDFGIERVADWSEDSVWLGTVQTRPGAVLNNWSVYTNTSSWWTYGGERTFSQGSLDLHGELRNFWGSSLRIGKRLPARTLRLRGGPLLNEEGAWVASGSIYSPQQFMLRMTSSYSFVRSDDPGSQSLSISPMLVWQPRSNATVMLGPNFARERSDIFYVAQTGATPDPHYILAALNHTTAALTTRLDLAFSPTLTLQLYGQPFLSAGTYGDFKDVVAPTAKDYAARFRRLDPVLHDKSYSADLNADGVVDVRFDDPAFNIREFRSNTVLRWEYRPGSTLFVVWSQGRHSDSGGEGFQLSRDASALFRAAPENVLLLKVTRWMSF